MKKIAALFLAVMVLVGSAVPALAAVNIGTVPLIESPLGKAGFVVEEDGVPIIQTFIVSTLTTEQRAIYDRFIALPDNRKLMIVDFGQKIVSLIVPDSGAKITGSVSSLFSIAHDGSLNFDYSSGRLIFGSSIPDGVQGVQTSSGHLGTPVISSLLMGRDFAQDIVNGTSSNPNANFLQYYPQNGQVGWRDDIEDEPSEPEPPTPSEPEPEPIPPWNPGKAPPPSSPGANKSPYVPYDVSVWDDFIAYLRTASGSATNIIILIMIPFIIVPLVISIIKHFASGGKGGGGGKTV